MDKIFLNIGCGNCKLDGFINIDLESTADLQLDVRNGLPFDDNSVNGIYSEHFIEHLTQSEAVAFLRECRRILKYEGILRMSTPNLSNSIQGYLNNDWREKTNLGSYGFGWLNTRCEYLNTVMREWGHKWTYDETELVRLAKYAGFYQFKRCESGISKSLSFFNNLESRKGNPLIIEAQKRKIEKEPDNPLVTILIPAYNYKYFSDALESALNQSYGNLEIIIGDDSHTEKINDIVEILKKQYPEKKLHYFREGKPGKGERKNFITCLLKSKGYLIKPLYDDDLLEHRCVERMVEYISKHPNVTLVTSHRQWIDSEGKKFPDINAPKRIFQKDVLINGSTIVKVLVTNRINFIGEPSTVMFRKEDLIDEYPDILSFAGRKTVMNLDVGIWMKLLSRGDCIYISETLSSFRLHKQQTQQKPGRHERGLLAWGHALFDAKRMGFLSSTVPQLSGQQLSEKSLVAKKIFSVSIIIVTYNSLEDVQRCIGSIESQTIPPYEIIIIDNNSTDGTQEYLKGVNNASVILNKENTGFSGACNQGIKISKGEYIVLLNPDTAVTKDWANRMIAHFKEGVGAVGPVSNYVAGLQKFEFYGKEPVIGEVDINKIAEKLYQWNKGKGVKTKLLIGFCLMIKKDVIESIGMLDEDLFLGSDDLEYTWRLRNNGYSLVVATDTFIYHKGQSSFKSEPEQKMMQFTQESQDVLYSKLKAHYGEGNVPSPMELWNIGWFKPTKAQFRSKISGAPLTSIIILTHNQLEYTKKCIESIFAQTKEPFELIVVDNGSTDGTVEYLESEIRDQRSEVGEQKSKVGGRSSEVGIEIIKNRENLGFAKGNNQGMAVAGGDYILLMNNDVVVTPGWLDRMISCVEKNSDIGMVGPVSNCVSGQQLVDDVKYNTSNLAGLNEFAANLAEKYSGRSRRILRVVGFCMLIKRVVVDKIGGLDFRYGLGNFEDDDFSLRAALAGFESWIAEDCFIHHFGNRTFIGAKIDYRESLYRNWEIFKEKWGLPKELSYGSPYNVMQISKDGFVPEKHYCPLTGRDSLWKNECGNTNFDSNSNAAEKIYINKVQLLVNEGKQEEATIALEELIILYPKFALAYNDLGVLYFNKGEKEKALSYYEKAVQLQPGNITYQKNLADFYYVELGRIEDALKLYNSALYINPEDTEILLIMGHICVSLKKFEDAKIFYNKVLQVDPTNEDARQILDKLLNHEQPVNTDVQVSIIVRTSGQQKYVKKCVESIEKYTSQSHEIIFADNGATKGTRKWLNQNIKENSNFIMTNCPKDAGSAEIINEGIKASTREYILLLSNDVVVTKGWLDGMFECLQSIPDAGIVGPMSNVSRGLQKVSTADNVSTDQLDEFAEYFMNKNRNRRISTFSIDGFCMLFRRDMVEEIGFFDEKFGQGGYEDEDFCLKALLEGRKNFIAGDVYVHQQSKKAVVRNKKYFNSKWNKADVQSPLGKKYLTLTAIEKGCDVYQRGHIDNAVEILLEGIGLSPDDKRPYYVLAEILLNAKNYKDAIDILNEMPQDEQDLRRLELIGYCKEGMGLDKEALNHADHALSIKSNSAQALNLKGILAFKRGDIKSAEDCFNRAIEFDPGYGEPYTNLGAILWDNQPEKGLNLFEKGFILSPTITDIVTNYHSAVTASGEFERAGQVFEEASLLYPNNKMIKYQFIDVLIKQEKNADAMSRIEETIALYGVDDGILPAALKIRGLLGPKKINKTKDKKNTVSLCMIVKNEEKYLARCLNSVKSIVDEMIVVDTGSTDMTKDIAKVFGAKVNDFEWTDDFSEARNYSISKASGNWTFHLDADEVISSLDYKAFRKIIKQSTSKDVAFLVNTRNYTMDVNQVEWTANDGRYDLEESATGWIPSEKVRLFRNESRIRFEYPVHEIVEPSLKRAGITVKECSIPVHHYGKLNKEKSSKKVEVYYQIGRKKLDKMGDDAVALRELAIQAEIIKKHDEAIELWERFIAIEPNVAKAYINMGISYCSLGKYGEVLETAKKALKLAPDMKEAHYNYALGKLHLGSAAEAVSILEKLLKRIGEYPPAQFLLAAAYCCDGKKEKGINELKELQKSSIGPGLPMRCHELAKGLISSHRNNYATMIFEAAIDSKISNKEVLELYSKCFEIMNVDRKTGTMGDL